MSESTVVTMFHHHVTDMLLLKIILQFCEEVSVLYGFIIIAVTYILIHYVIYLFKFFYNFLSHKAMVKIWRCNIQYI
jgi:hypothetical protein